jgi:hypothetical protein
VAEWSKAHAWNACRRATVSWVRIPPSPPPWQPSGGAAAPLDGYARTDKFDGVAESAEQLIMHGIDGAFGWLLLIDKNSNKASMSFATADTTLSGFGTCTNK